MKNHPVNNDYVQNLQEGLVSEAAFRMGKKEKGAKPRQTHVGEADNMGNVATNSARRKNIKDVGMKPMSGTGPGEVRPFDPGTTNISGGDTRKLKKVNEAAVRLGKKVRGEKPFQSRNPETNRLESEISNNDDYTIPSKIRPDGSVKKGSTEQNASQSNEDWLTDNDDPKVKAKHTARRQQRKLARKVKPAPVAAAQMESKQTVYQSEDKPENNSYLDKDVKLDPFPIKKPTLKKKEIKESYDLANSRLSDEELKVDKNVKTRGIKKVRGQKPVPMVNSDGEKIGEQDSGVRPRSQDLNTRGRLNQSREGEGMIAKGKRFLKKKFS